MGGLRRKKAIDGYSLVSLGSERSFDDILRSVNKVLKILIRQSCAVG